MQSEIFNLRKQIFIYLKEKALSYETSTPEITQYQKNQQVQAEREFSQTDMTELLKRVEQADVTYVGDFHTFDQNIRNVLRILKVLIHQKEKPLIGLEMIDHNHQMVLDYFMEGHITELEFLEEINYHDSWRFPWSHYRLIFELAKENKIGIVALNKEGTLQQRDVFASEKIQEIFQQNPKTKLIVLYGELHISPNKIPALTELKVPELKQVIIHQNLDNVYWKLLEENVEQGVVKFKDNEFCLITAPPWVKYESMVYWYENLCNDPEFDIHNYIIENGKKIFSDDSKENFFQICLQLINFLSLKIEEDTLEDFNLYDHTALEYVEELLQSNLDQNLRQFYEYLIATNKSFRFLDNKFYCSSYSLNRISYLAGIHILHFYFRKSGLNPLSVYQSQDAERFISLMTLEAMMAYFFSKIINPHRKCEMYKDLQLKTNFTNQTSAKISTLSLSLIHLETPNIDLEKFTLPELYETSLNVGHILGEYLYMIINEKKILFDLETFLEKLHFEFSVLIELKNNILSNFDYKAHQKRYF